MLVSSEHEKTRGPFQLEHRLCPKIMLLTENRYHLNDSVLPCRWREAVFSLLKTPLSSDTSCRHLPSTLMRCVGRQLWCQSDWSGHCRENRFTWCRNCTLGETLDGRRPAPGLTGTAEDGDLKCGFFF